MRGDHHLMPFQATEEPGLRQLIVNLVRRDRMTVQEVVDLCSKEGFDGRSAIAELGIMLMEGEILPVGKPGPVYGSSVIALPDRDAGTTVR